MKYEVTILWNRVHKFPKVPRQYFVTPVFDNLTRAVLGFRGFWVSRLMAYGCWVQGDCGIG